MFFFVVTFKNELCGTNNTIRVDEESEMLENFRAMMLIPGIEEAFIKNMHGKLLAVDKNYKDKSIIYILGLLQMELLQTKRKYYVQTDRN